MASAGGFISTSIQNVSDAADKQKEMSVSSAALAKDVLEKGKEIASLGFCLL